jgi:hypothetical protein
MAVEEGKGNELAHLLRAAIAQATVERTTYDERDAASALWCYD